MQKPTAAEMSHAVTALAPEINERLEVLDGTTIDNWGEGCPFAAAAAEQGRVKVLPQIVRVGSEVHEAISRLIVLWCECGGTLSPGELAHNLESELRSTCPDVQPEAIRACKASVFAIAKRLFQIHPANILAFDGGDEIGKSGQLAVDLEGVNVRLTSEVDLLFAGPSPELLHEIDWKTGWKLHDAQSVADSGQFQRHAILVFESYPDVNGLECQLWDTRTNQQTFRVVFHRKHLPDYRARVLMAIQKRHEHQGNPPTWPTVERCRICPAATICPVVDEPLRQVSESPEAFLSSLIAVEAKLDAMHELAAAYVDKYGTIEVGDVCYGRDAPRSTKKQPTKLYRRGATDECENDN